LLAFTAIASGVLSRPYGDAVTTSISRLITTACVLLLIWRLGWLGSIGIVRLGRWRIWLIALGGIIYFSSASLYSFYSEISFDFSNLLCSGSAHAIVITQFIVALCEEVLFRGLVLYSLVRVWGVSKKGIVGSVILTSLLFAVPHLMQIFTSDVSILSVLVVILEGSFISIWWGALVLWGESIWPAIMSHFIGNAIIALQGLVIPMVDPEILAYERLLFFSLLLGVLGFVLLLKIIPGRFVD
jgi:membrane protease YdiL (CAAX protease family)